MGCLQPRSYAANARHIHLNDRACAALQIFAKMEWTVEAFADGDGNSRCARETNVPIEIICSERLFELANIEGLIQGRPADRVIDGESLVSVSEDLKGGPDRRPHRRQSLDIFTGRSTDLDLGAAETGRLRFKRVRDQRLCRQVQPAPSVV